MAGGLLSIETGGFSLRKFNHFLILLIAEIVAIEECGVEGVVVFSHFVMQVTAGGSPRISHIANELSAFDFLSGPHCKFAEVSVQRGISVAMIDDDVVAIAPWFGFYLGDGACGGGVYFGACGGGEIHAGVKGGGVVKGIAAIPKSGGHLTEVFVGHGHDGGDGIDGVDAVFRQFLEF